MRRALLSSLALLCLSLAALGTAGSVYLDAVLKEIIERAGPRLTGTPVKVRKVETSLRRGTITLRGLRVRNPKGFRIQNAFMAEEISIRIRRLPLLSGRIVLEDVYVRRPTVVYEGLVGGNNLKTLRRNIESSDESGAEPRAGSKRRKNARTWRIVRFRARDGEIVVASRLLGRRKGVTLDMPPIDLRDVGGPDGEADLRTAASEIAASLASGASEAVRESELPGALLKSARELREKAEKSLK